MKVILINGRSNTGKTTICNKLIDEAINKGNLIYNLCPKKPVNRVALIKLDNHICLVSSAGDLSTCINDNNEYIESANKYLSEHTELKRKEIDILIFTARSAHQENPIYRLADQLAKKNDPDYINIRTKKVESNEIDSRNNSIFHEIMKKIAEISFR